MVDFAYKAGILGDNSALRFAGSTGLAPTQTREQTLQSGRDVVDYNDPEGFASKAIKSIAAAPLDLVDTVGSSFGFGARGDINDKVLRGAGWDSAADWVRDNQSSVEVASGIGGVVATTFIPSMLIPKIMESAMVEATTLGQGYKALNAVVGSAQKASQGAELQAAKNGEFLKLLSPANRTYLAVKAGKYAGIAATEEALLATTMHTNTFLFDQENMSVNLFYAGLGIVGGGALGAIGARYGIRKWANSPLVRDVRGESLDPGAYSTLRTNIGAPAPSASNLTLKDSSLLTAQMLDAKYDVKAGAGATSPNLQSNRSALQDQVQGQAWETLQKITSKGTPLIPDSKFPVALQNRATSEGQHLKETLNADPAALFGADSLAKVPADGNLFNIIKDRSKLIDDLLQSEDPKDIAYGQRLANQHAMVLVNKSFVPDVEVGQQIVSYTPAKIQKASTTQERSFATAAGDRIRVSEFGDVYIDRAGKATKVSNNVANWESLTFHEQLDTFAALRETLDYRVKTKSPFILPQNPSWIQIDYALELAKRGGVIDSTSKAGLATLHDLQVASLKKKGVILGNRSGLSELDRIRYNLPLPSSFERVVDPHGDSLKILFQAAARKGITPDDLVAARKAGQQMLELAQEQKPHLGFDGNIFNFNRSTDGDWMKPVLGFFSDDDPTRWNKFSLAQDMAESKSIKYHALTDSQTGGRLTKQLTEEIYGSELLADAQKVDGLADNQVTGTGNYLGTVAGSFVTQSMRNRQNPTLLAAEQIRYLVNRQTDHHLAKVIATHMGDVQNRMLAANAYASRHLLNQFLSNSAGWDLERGTVASLTKGQNAFVLKDTAANAARLGRKVNPGELLINPRTGKEIVLDDLGQEFMTRFNGVTDEMLREKNAVRNAMGLKPMKNRPWYTPPPDTRGKFIGFTFDANNELVPGGAIVADTAEEFNRLKSAHEKGLPPDQRFILQGDIQAHGDLWDKAQMDWVDPSSLMAKGARAQGTLSSSTVNQQALHEAMEWVRRSYQKVADDTIRVVFEGPMAAVKANKAVQEKRIGTTTRSVFDHYEDALLGRMAGRSEKSPTGRIFERVDAAADAALAHAWPAARGGYQHVRDLFQRLGVRMTPKGQTFKDLVNELGANTPYKNQMDYLEQTHRLTPPPEIKKIGASINKLSAALILRVLELPQAAMNMAGIITNMPSILQSRGMRTLPTIGKNGSKIQILDTYKIMAQGFKDMLSRKTSHEWEYMKRNGDTTQSVAELNQQLGLIHSQSTFSRVMLGDPASKSKIGQKGITGLLSVATDVTEEMSRSWAHFIGLRLADAHGIVGQESRHNFAREIANSAIANYNPLDRPEVFHSALGSMYGLFASYMLQYNMRLFRWMEEGKWGSLGRQVATQSSMFGFGSAPGFDMLQWAAGGGIVGDPGEGETPIDGIYKRFGPLAGSAVAHGGVAELTRLFTGWIGGDQGTGAALYTRGDANIRSPNLNVTQQMAGLGVITNIASGIWELAEQTLSDGTVKSANRVSEILARHLPNRALKGALTVLMNQGQDTDASGQVVAETRNSFETVYRILGTRSVRQQGEIEAYFLNNQALNIDAARLATLRVSTRAAIRGGNVSGEALAGIFQKYLDSGGKPWNYSAWIRSQVREANDPRGQKQLLQAMRSPGYEALARRIELMSGVDHKDSLVPR